MIEGRKWFTQNGLIGEFHIKKCFLKGKAQDFDITCDEALNVSSTREVIKIICLKAL
jgi:hypothetical protein